MSTEKWLFAIVIIGFFSQSVIWSARYEVETLYEKKFDIPIANALLDSYIEKDTQKFYLKIVDLTQYIYSGDLQPIEGTKEIRIFNYQDKIIKKLDCNPWDRFGYSRKNNYFYVFSGNLAEHDELSSICVFKVYNDKGELMYKIDGLMAGYENGYDFYLSSKDGSAVIKISSPYYMESYIEFYDKWGKKRESELTERERHNIIFDFADNMEYIVSISMKYPEKLLTGYTEPTILFMDSLGKILWERILKENVLSSRGVSRSISAQGSYIYASGYYFDEFIKMNGYIFNKEGKLEMKIPNGYEPLCFSQDENYLLINRAKPYHKGTREKIGRIYGMALIDVKNKKILFDKDGKTIGIPTSVGGAAIGIDGKVAFVQTDIDVDKDLETRVSTTNCCIRVLDREGNLLYDSEPFFEDYAKLIADNMRWAGSNLVYIWVDETRKTLQVKSVQFMEE